MDKTVDRRCPDKLLISYGLLIGDGVTLFPDLDIVNYFATHMVWKEVHNPQGFPKDYLLVRPLEALFSERL